MLQRKRRRPQDEIVDTMIDLARLGKMQRIVLAGHGSMEIYLALRQRGFAFSVLASTCRAAGKRMTAASPGCRSAPWMARCGP